MISRNHSPARLTISPRPLPSEPQPGFIGICVPTGTAIGTASVVHPACTCKPAGESWAQALENAERVLGHERKGDIIVTPEKSAEMSRPTLTAAQRSKLLGTTSAKAAAAAAKANKSGDDLAAHDAADAEQVPTASDDSAGIATGEVKQGDSYSEGQGKSVEVTGPDGAKHQVRIVGPQP